MVLTAVVPTLMLKCFPSMYLLIRSTRVFFYRKTLVLQYSKKKKKKKKKKNTKSCDLFTSHAFSRNDRCAIVFISCR